MPLNNDDFVLKKGQCFLQFQVHYPFDSQRATTFASSSSKLDSVWALNQNSVKMLGLDMYSDSNARQRSDDCQADSMTASYAQVAATAELAMPRQQMQMVMDFTHIPGQFQPNPPGIGGYTVVRWADWTVLPALHVVNDALFTGDLRLAHQYFDSLLEWHLYSHQINASDTLGAGLVVDNTGPCASDTDNCLSCLIDTSGGSDDNYQQSNANAVVQAWVYYAMTQVAGLARWIGKVSKTDEFCITNEELCIKNDEICRSMLRASWTSRLQL